MTHISTSCCGVRSSAPASTNTIAGWKTRFRVICTAESWATEAAVASRANRCQPSLPARLVSEASTAPPPAATITCQYAQAACESEDGRTRGVVPRWLRVRTAASDTALRQGRRRSYGRARVVCDGSVRVDSDPDQTLGEGL